MINPNEIMSEAAESESGLTLTFADGVSLKKFRFRCYSARRVEAARLIKELTARGNSDMVVGTGWDKLVFITKAGNKLWIGKPTKNEIGLLKIEKTKKRTKEIDK